MSVINQMLRDLDHSRRLDPAILAVTLPETVPATVPANPDASVSLWRWLAVAIAVLAAGYAGLRWFETAPVAATPALVVNTPALEETATSAATATPTTAPTTTVTAATTAPQVTVPEVTAPQVTPVATEPVRQQSGSRLAETASSQQQPILQVVQDVQKQPQAPIEPRPTASQSQPLARSLLPAESVPVESFAAEMSPSEMSPSEMSPKHMQVDAVVVPAGTATLQAASARQTALTQLAQQARQALAQGLWQQAQQLAQLYVQQAPDDIEGYQLLANAQQQQGDYAAALQSWQQVLQLDPTLARAWLGSALVYDQLSQRAQARAAYQQALRLGGLAPASQQFIQQRLQQQSSF